MTCRRRHAGDEVHERIDQQGGQPAAAVGAGHREGVFGERVFGDDLDRSVGDEADVADFPTDRFVRFGRTGGAGREFDGDRFRVGADQAGRAQEWVVEFHLQRKRHRRPFRTQQIDRIDLNRPCEFRGRSHFAAETFDAQQAAGHGERCFGQRFTVRRRDQFPSGAPETPPDGQSACLIVTSFLPRTNSPPLTFETTQVETLGAFTGQLANTSNSCWNPGQRRRRRGERDDRDRRRGHYSTCVSAPVPPSHAF